MVQSIAIVLLVTTKLTKIIEPNTVNNNGYRFLEINDEHPQSIFNAYYAKYEFTSYYRGAELTIKIKPDTV